MAHISNLPISPSTLNTWTLTTEEYLLLTMVYRDGLTIDEAGQRLHMSQTQSQYYHDHWRGRWQEVIDNIQLLKSLPKGPCFSELTLKVFLDGHFSGQEREELLQHLSCCSSCYRRWQQLAEHRYSRKGNPENLLRQWWTKIDWVFGGLIIVSITMVAMLALSLWLWFQPPSLSHSIDDTYESVLANYPAAVKQALHDFHFPWQTPLSPTPELPDIASPSPAAQAFAAGIWSGQQTLLGNHHFPLPSVLLPPTTKSTWLATHWQNDFELGRWLLLLWTVTQFPFTIPNPFWEQQQQIFTQLHTYWVTQLASSDQEIDHIVSVLEPLSLLLHQLSHQNEPLLYKQLSKELQFLLDNLSL